MPWPYWSYFNFISSAHAVWNSSSWQKATQPHNRLSLFLFLTIDPRYDWMSGGRNLLWCRVQHTQQVFCQSQKVTKAVKPQVDELLGKVHNLQQRAGKVNAGWITMVYKQRILKISGEKNLYIKVPNMSTKLNRLIDCLSFYAEGHLWLAMMFHTLCERDIMIKNLNEGCIFAIISPWGRGLPFTCTIWNPL
jgi:hypothetical protein